MSHVRAATISPTNITNETEIYDISSSNQYDNIICSRPECQIICNATDACYKININAESSDIFNLQCINKLSCESIAISKSASIYNNIDCLSKSSCYNAKFNLFSNAISSPNITISCDYIIKTHSVDSPQESPCNSAIFKIDNASNVTINCRTEYSCLSTEFHLFNLQHAEFNLSSGSALKYALIQTNIDKPGIIDGITINADALYALYQSTIYCPFGAKCDINCNTAHSCSNYLTPIYIPDRNYEGFQLGYTIDDDDAAGIDIYCHDTGKHTELNTDSTNGRMECQIGYMTTSYDCCPPQFVTDIFTCTSGDCVYDCTDTSSITCANSIINGASATSLTVLCNSGKSVCNGARIKCPSTDYSNCTIDCEGSTNCQFITIEANTANHIDTFQLNCGGGGGVCEYGIFLLDALSINTMNISLYIGSSIIDGPPPNFYLSDNMNISSFNYKCESNCDETSIFMFKDAGITIDSADIYCGDCGDIAYFDLIVKNKLSITCRWSWNYPCTGTFDIEILNLTGAHNIQCINPSTSSSSACSGNFSITQPAIPNGNSILVDCTGHGTCSGGIFNFTNVFSVTMNCSGASSCDQTTTIADTTQYFTMFCDNYGTYPYGGCKESIVYCPSWDVDVCGISCFNDTQVCNSMTIYSEKDYTRDYLKLECGHDPQVCEEYPRDSACRESCADITIGCKNGDDATGIQYDYNSSEYQCISSGCCPWSNVTTSTTRAPTTTVTPVTSTPTTTTTITLPTAKPVATTTTMILTTKNPTTMKPAANPTTSIPTTLILPSMNPTTITPTAITRTSTMNPTDVIITTKSGNESASSESKRGLTTLEIILIVIIIVLVVLILAYVGFKGYKRIKSDTSRSRSMSDNHTLLNQAAPL